jgi:hypothetical protein
MHTTNGSHDEPRIRRKAHARILSGTRSRRMLAAAGMAVATAGTALALAGPASANAITGSVVTAIPMTGTIGGPASQEYEIGLQIDQGDTPILMTAGSTDQGSSVNYELEGTETSGVAPTSQLWQFVPDNGADDLFQNSWGELKNLASGLCLNVDGASTAAGTQLIQWPCVNSANEEWQATPVTGTVPGGRAFGFESKEASGVYLGYDNAMCGTEKDANVVTTSTEGGYCASWFIQRVGGQPMMLPNAADNSQTIDSNNPDGNWLTQAITNATTSYPASPTQVWYLQEAGTTDVHVVSTENANGTIDFGEVAAPLYRIVQVTNNDWADAVCLEAEGNSPEIGSEVETYGCDPNAMDQPNQLWILDNSYLLGGSFGGVDYNDTGVRTVFDANNFLMYNDAMLGANETTQNYPVLSETSTIVPVGGSQLTMQDQNSTVEPYRTQVWSVVQPPSPPSAPSSSSGTACVGEACLLDSGLVFSS